jgi:hypothetical protein
MSVTAECPAARLRAVRRIALLLALAGVGAWQAALAAAYVGRPVYSEPATGLQLPPGCEVDPSWRSSLTNADLEVWVAQCDGAPRVWLLKRQVIEVMSGRQSRLRFQILDERIYPDEVAGDTLSVQCSGPRDESGYVVRGARWRPDGKELHLKSAKGALHAELRAQNLADADLATVDCVRFPEREAMMKRLQQHN